MSTRVTIQLFAGARALAGSDEIEVSVPEGATYGDLAAALQTAAPEIAQLVAASRLAANAGYATPDQAVDPAAEIALIPPVSGG